MNKKYLPLIIAGIVLVIIVLFGITISPLSRNGSDFNAKITIIDKSEDVTISTVNVLVDNSGSMKGYSEFAGYPSAQRLFVSNTTKLLQDIASEYDASFSIKCGSFNTSNRDQFRSRLTDGSIFSGPVTNLDKMFTDCVANTDDSSVSILLTDMVLSYGKSRLQSEHDPDYNFHHLEDLGATIYTALKSTTVDLLVLQYYSDFNGKYYYNYTENINNGTQYNNNLLNKRPYYIVVFGSKPALKSLLANEVFPAYENIYASFGLADTDYTSSDYQVKLSATSNWLIGDESGLGTLWTKSDLQNDKEKFTVSIKKFDIPAFVNKKYSIDFADSNVIDDVEDITSDSDKDLQFIVTMKPYSILPSDSEAEFKFISSFDWVNNASIDNDADITDISELEGKTWGFSTILKNIDQAYFKNGRNPDTIAEFTFRVVKL